MLLADEYERGKVLYVYSTDFVCQAHHLEVFLGLSFPVTVAENV